jgi:uncharacterized protein
VAGLGPALAAAIVERREKDGPFRSRRQLLEVPRLGPKAFEQAAGFLRVPGGEHPLDATGVHPERYAALEALAASLGKGVGELLGPGAALVREAASLKEELGAWTWEDVVAELERPGRDLRAAFVPFCFREDVQKLEDLKPGMVCPGIVSNVTSFGAFVDVGVRQDGLVHVSQLGAKHARDAQSVLKPGDRVQVLVLKVDLEKKQISLTTRIPPPQRGPAPAKPRPPRRPVTRARPAAGASPVPNGEARPAPPRRPGPRPDRPRSPLPADRPRPAPLPGRGPAVRPPAERRPESRRPAFNNPFAVLASLKVPPKRDKS